ncbi:MAG TPA: peptidylprolyl isomerase, partial [Ktedonobacteraceae bacterium]|nr:peptidylprolyl isomerase [Ktedonobacteraceae bacterium]
MTSQTVRRPENQRQNSRNTRPDTKNKPKKYVKQTARFEGRRDKKPLIFGWGGHLSHSEKVRLQRRATWTGAIAFAVLIVVVLVGFWVDFNVIIPGLTITSVNGQAISQGEYRELVALKAQIEQNKIYGVNGLTAQENSIKKQMTAEQNIVSSTTTQITNLQKQLKATGLTSAQRTSLNTQIAAQKKAQAAAQAKYTSLNSQYTNMNTNTIPLEQQLYNQPQIANDSATWLQNDLLIQQWLQTQSSAIQAKINPTQSEINTFLNGVKANLPAGTTYGSFLSKDGVSDSNMQQMAGLMVRRQNMQNYLASLEVSPQYQVLARMITLSTLKDADSILTQLHHGGDFAKLAVAKSVDTNTNKLGGYLGWEARGQYAQAYSSSIVENWMFAPSRTLDEISPVIVENGSYRIVQILGVDPSRAVDKPTLQTLQTNALANWLLQIQALPSTKITTADQSMLLNTANMPPDLPATAPGSSVPGAPASQPGAPGQSGASNTGG